MVYQKNLANLILRTGALIQEGLTTFFSRIPYQTNGAG
jgi:hypothetical protein